MNDIETQEQIRKLEARVELLEHRLRSATMGCKWVQVESQPEFVQERQTLGDRYINATSLSACMESLR